MSVKSFSVKSSSKHRLFVNHHHTSRLFPVRWCVAAFSFTWCLCVVKLMGPKLEMHDASSALQDSFFLRFLFFLFFFYLCVCLLLCPFCVWQWCFASYLWESALFPIGNATHSSKCHLVYISIAVLFAQSFESSWFYQLMFYACLCSVAVLSFTLMPKNFP